MTKKSSKLIVANLVRFMASALFLLCLSLVAQYSMAQQQTATDDSIEQVETSTEDDADAQEADSGADTDQDTPQTVLQNPAPPAPNPDASFTPTEEISEDQPVPFPVDI